MPSFLHAMQFCQHSKFARHALHSVQSICTMHDMKSLGEVIRDRRKSLELTLEQVANQVPGYDAGNLSRFERGLSSIQLDKLEALADALGSSVGDLYHLRVAEPTMDYNVSPATLRSLKVPLISWVQAGLWTSQADNYHPGDAEDWITPSERVSSRSYALRVRGDSMLNPNGLPTFPEGIVIIVEPDVEAKVGDFVVVRWNGDDATFKQLTRESGRFYLTPLNPRYPVVEMPSDAILCGVVKEAQFKVR